MEISASLLVTPGGEEFDLTLVHATEARIPEIAYVTPTKAPELLSVLSRACFTLGRALPVVYLGLQKAKQRVANRKAVLVIDVIPGILAEKKLSSNAETRQALMDLDPEYQKAVEAELEYAACVMYVRRKIEDMENALNSVKKILGETGDMHRRPNYNMYDVEAVTNNPTQTDQLATTGSRIGKPRY